MRKKLALMFAAALAVCGTAGILTACDDEPPQPSSQKFNSGDKYIEELEGEFTYNEGELVTEKYNAKKYNVRYLVDESSYITLSGQKLTELVIDGYKGDIKKLSVADIENNIIVDNARVSVVGIKEGVFANCNSLEEVDLTKANNSLTFAIGSRAFANCDALTKVKMPDNLYTSSLAVGSEAFLNDIALTDLTLGDKVNDIGHSAFKNCTALTSVTIPSTITKIAKSTFEYCDSLSSLTFGDGTKLKTIQKSAFKGTALTSFDLSGLTGLKHIGNEAFRYTKLTAVSVPDSVTYIGEAAFKDCENLATVNVPFLGNSIAHSATFNSIYGMSGEDTRALTVTAKAAVAILNESFKDVKNISSLTITAFTTPGTYQVHYPLIDTDNDQYGSQDGLSFDWVEVTEIDAQINETYKTIGDRAFYGCESLATAVLPADTESIGDRAFENCQALTTFVIPATVEDIGEFAFKECVSYKPVLPASLKTIDRGAFAGCSAIEEMTIPASVNYVVDGAFYGCKNLKKVTIGRLNGLEAPRNDNDEIVGYYYASLYNFTKWAGREDLGYFSGESFKKLTKADVKCNVEDVTVSELYTLPENTFKGMTTLKNVSLTFTDIDDSLFGEDSRFSKPSDLPTTTEIGQEAFSGCTSLATVTITDANSLVKSVSQSAFENCEALASFTIPEAVKTIGQSAFSGCSSLSSVSIPAAVKTIEESAFAKCVGFTSFTVPATVETVSNNVLAGCKNLTTLTVDGYNKVVDDKYLSHGELDVNSDGYPDVNLSNWFGGAPASVTTLTLNDVNNLVSSNLSAWSNLSELSVAFIGTIKTGSGRNAVAHYTTIGESALSSLENLTSLNITGGDKVKIIGNEAFSNCKIVNNAHLEKFTNVVNIGSNAFSGCDKITQVTLPGTLELISDNVFYNCPDISVLNIGNYATFGIGSVARIFGADSPMVEVPDTDSHEYKYINVNGINVPKALETITVSGIESIYNISSQAFNNMSMVKAIALNTSTDKGYYVFSQYNYASFNGCDSLQKIFIPDSITTIYLGEGISNLPYEIGYETGSATLYRYTRTLTSYGNYWHGSEDNPRKHQYDNRTYTFEIGENSAGWEGGIDKSTKRITTTNNQPLKETDIPKYEAREGYKLIGWYNNAWFYGEPVTFPYYSTDSTTLWAKWLPEAQSVCTTTFTNFEASTTNTTTTGSVSSKFESNTVSDNAEFTLTVVKKSTVTLTVNLSGETVLGSSQMGGTLTVENDGRTIFTIDNSGNHNYGEEDRLVNSTSSKTLNIVVYGGDSLVVRLERSSVYNGGTTYYYGIANASYSVVDYTATKSEITVNKPAIPETTIPKLDISSLETVKGTTVDADTFEDAMTDLKNINSSTGFTCEIVLNSGEKVVEEYAYNTDKSDVLKQVVSVGDVSNTYYYEPTGSNSLKVYYQYTDEQIDKLIAQYPDMKDYFTQMKGKWDYDYDYEHSSLRISTGLSVVDTVKDNYTYVEEKGTYWQVVSGKDGYQVVLAVSIETDGKAHYYLAFYKYNELWMQAKYEKINDTTVAIPSEVLDNLFDMSQM